MSSESLTSRRKEAHLDSLMDEEFGLHRKKTRRGQRMRSKLFSGIGVFLAISLTVMTSTAAFGAEEAPKSIKIGAVIDVTGPLAAFGVQCKWGYEKAAQDINKQGGIFVKEFNKKIPVEMLYGDHQANEQKSVTEVEFLIQKGVTVLSGTTAITPLGLPVAEKHHVPMVENSSESEPLQQGFKYVFALFFMTEDMAKYPFEVMASVPDPKPTKIGFMEEQDLMGQDYSETFQKEVAKRNFKNVVIEKYQRFSNDFSNSILKFKQGGVDLVYAPMIGPDGILFWKQMKQLDYNPKAVIMLSAPAVRKDWLSMGKDADYVITTNCYHWALPYAGVKQLADAYRADNKGENPPEFAGSTYAMMQVIKDAIERAGTLNKDKIRDALAASNTMTVQGPVKFRPNGMPIIKQFLVQYQNGVETIVWPRDLAEKPMVYPFPPWKSR